MCWPRSTRSNRQRGADSGGDRRLQVRFGTAVSVELNAVIRPECSTLGLSGHPLRPAVRRLRDTDASTGGGASRVWMTTQD